MTDEQMREALAKHAQLISRATRELGNKLLEVVDPIKSEPIPIFLPVLHTITSHFVETVLQAVKTIHGEELAMSILGQLYVEQKRKLSTNSGDKTVINFTKKKKNPEFT